MIYRRVARIASADVSEPAILCFESVHISVLEWIVLQLKKNLALNFSLREAMTDERANHVLLNFLVWTKSLLGNFLRDSRCTSD